jgi:hypothetical protein
MQRLLATAILFLLIIVTGTSHAQPVPHDVMLEGKEITTQEACEAAQSVTARNTTVKNGSDLDIKAGDKIRLEAGFKIEKAQHSALM